MKTLCSDEWKALQVVVFNLFQCDDTKQNELTIKKNNNMTMNVDKSDTHWMIRFADFQEKNKTTDKLTSSVLKTKNVWLTNILCYAAEKNSI